MGGTIECMYFAFGDTDIYAICELPNSSTAVAVSLLINSSGSVEISLTPLLTTEDIDAAAAKNPSYRPPGA